MSIPGPVFVSEGACGTNYAITQRKENIRLITTLQTVANNKNKRIIHIVDVVDDCFYLFHVLIITIFHYITISIKLFIPSCFIIVMKDGA